MRTLAMVMLLCACAGAADDVGVDGGETAAAVDAGTRVDADDAGCGLSFDAARAAYPGERVCQQTEYDLVTGYCTHWVACSSL